MLSVPAATTMSALPVMMVWAPMMSALIDEAHTLLMVVETTDSGRPAPIATWRAGFWPRLQAVNTIAWKVLGVLGVLLLC